MGSQVIAIWIRKKSRKRYTAPEHRPRGYPDTRRVKLGRVLISMMVKKKKVGSRKEGDEPSLDTVWIWWSHQT